MGLHTVLENTFQRFARVFQPSEVLPSTNNSSTNAGTGVDDTHSSTVDQAPAHVGCNVTMKMTNEQPRIAIIGAGLTGLSIAHGLKKNGFDNVAVFDADAHVNARDRDWTILLHWGIPDLKSLLPEVLAAELRDRASANPYGYDSAHPLAHCMPAFSGVDGHLVFSMPAEGAIRVSRQKLRRALVREFQDMGEAGRTVIGWGKELKSWDVADAPGPVTLRFGDGTTFEADYVLGADGTSSRVRELLMGKEAAAAVESGLVFATALIRDGDPAKTQAVLDIHPLAALVFFEGSLGGVGVMDAPDPDDHSAWTTFWVRLWLGDRTSMRDKEAIDHVRAMTKGAWEPFQKIVDSTPDDSKCFASNMKYWIPSEWDNRGGRVTLVGDAAHSMLPFRAQGLQHAIADAKKYVGCHLAIRADPSVREKAMQEFDADVVSRGQEAVRQSLQEAQKALDPSEVASMDMARKGLARNT